MGVGWRMSLAICVLLLAVAGIDHARAGECLSRPEPFHLASDTVHWSFSASPGVDCLQGLRGRTMLLDQVRIVEPPKAGSLTISGPSFRYVAPASPAADAFKIEVTGENRRVRGSSIIEVDVLPP